MKSNSRIKSLILWNSFLLQSSKCSNFFWQSTKSSLLRYECLNHLLVLDHQLLILEKLSRSHDFCGFQVKRERQQCPLFLFSNGVITRQASNSCLNCSYDLCVKSGGFNFMLILTSSQIHRTPKIPTGSPANSRMVIFSTVSYYHMQCSRNFSGNCRHINYSLIHWQCLLIRIFAAYLLHTNTDNVRNYAVATTVELIYTHTEQSLHPT